MWKTGIQIQFFIVTTLILHVMVQPGFAQSAADRRIASQATKFANNLDAGGTRTLNSLIQQNCAASSTVNTFRKRWSSLGKVKARRTTLVRSGSSSSSVSDWSAKRSSRFGSTYRLSRNQVEVQFSGLSDVGSIGERYIFSSNTKCPDNLQLISYDYLESY